jgi:hypothetical protein
MEPLYTLLLCLPAALALIACGCGVALLWAPCDPAHRAPYSQPAVGQEERSKRWQGRLGHEPNIG